MATWRPIDAFPGVETKHRNASPFSATWTTTLRLLERELEALGASRVVIMLDIRESDVRLDGQVRADARPSTPRVVVAFETKRLGPLKYACDRFNHWQSNVRAIALGLEALRKVERYGIANRGEQYTGWRALPAGLAMPSTMSIEEATALLARYSGLDSAAVLGDPPYAFRLAAKAHHPDVGGDADVFDQLTRARDVLEASGANP